MLNKYILEKKEIEMFWENEIKGIYWLQTLTEGNPKKSSSDRRKMISVGNLEMPDVMKSRGKVAGGLNAWYLVALTTAALKLVGE